MTRYRLRDPRNDSHIERLKGRLATSLADAPRNPYDPSHAQAVAGTLADVVRAMERGAIPLSHVHAVFEHFGVPGFGLAGWLTEMVADGVYLRTEVANAA